MSISVHRFLGAALCGLLFLATTDAGATSVNLIPLPAQMSVTGESFSVNVHTPIVVRPGDAGARQSADYLAALVARTRALPLAVAEGVAHGPAIIIERDAQAPVDNPEGYVLDVTAQGIHVVARTDAGLFYGAITVSQLLTPDAAAGDVQVPGLHIRDEPRFAWRGLMLDSARHFQSPDDVRVLIDQMAQHKLNTLHWHFTDDQGWRIEIKRYPELARIGGWRASPGGGPRYGGYYTQDDIRAIVAYAAARHITIVPELDMPGHSQAAVAAFPELGATGKLVPVSPDWGVHSYLYNVDDNTLHFLQNVLDEVMALFPSTYIHLGGDEAVKDQWENSPLARERMNKLGLKSADALQGWFIGQMGQYLARHDRRLIGWDEILEGGAPANATVMSWRGTKGAIDAARLGHDVVLSPAPTLYFDQLQSDRDDETAGRLPAQSLQAVYEFEAVPSELSPAQARHVLGEQANVWTEHMPTLRHIEHAVFPRMDALAEAAWTPPADRNWHGFLQRLPAQLARYRAQGVLYADSALAPSIEVDRNAAINSGHASVTLSNQAGYGNLHYTVDGSLPGIASPLYVTPFAVTLPATVKVVALADDGTTLAAPRERRLSVDALRSRSDGELDNCPGSDFRLRVQPTPNATSLSPTYVVNVFDNCRSYRAAQLDGIAAIRVDVARLQRNFQLAHDAKLVVVHTPSSEAGELVVREDSCKGAVLATLPLPNADTFTLQGALPHHTGTHDLCMLFQTSAGGPLYGIGQVSLLPAAAH